jgi:elongation factor Ts
MVKALREKTGVGMMDCKKALEQANGDLDAAVDVLRKSGAAKAEKKASRATREGVIFSAVTPQVAALVEIVCETDFVARNERFCAYGKALAGRVAAMAGADGDLAAQVAAEEKAAIIDLVNAIGENIQIRRVSRWEAKGGASLGFYDHQQNHKIVVLVEAAGGTAELLKDACMHIAAYSPRYIKPDDIPAAVIEKEKEIAQAQVGDKPANMIANIVKGKVNKWYTEVCLLQQPWFKDEKSCLAKLAPALAVKRMLRWQIGEEATAQA